MFDLTGKIALVTGAGRGMGKADAAALTAQGATVVSTDIVADGDVIALDVSKKAEVDAVFADVEKKFGRLDILVNNAGIYQPTLALDMTEEVWDRTIDINLKGQFLCAQAAARIMKMCGGGRIINITSIASGGVGVGIMGAAHYTSSKGGIIAMTETLAVEWAQYGILVNAIAPGAIDTPMAHTPPVAGREEAQPTLGQRVPLKRIGRPDEVASAVVFLASDEASYITGSTMYVDGGWLAA